MNTCLLIFICFIIIFFLKPSKNIEGLDETTGGYCEKCDGLTFGQCMRCYNCGFCGNGYKGQCINGTMFGPNKPEKNVFSVEFNNNPDTSVSCPRYYNNDTFWRYLHLDKADKGETADCVFKPFD